ncbi:cytochrome c biogenesis CcdA family protein [Alicyclobacillus sp. ALC3]|uniref:cytochrome c biogenesis CcdA family protein n=1 Tax=Alicyclobacillus sp. ALC3 TaxID=2796143 RepID=UPI002378392B|nr:cytochrome c biogenesis protein CcdA [Alicyclobacillus sp. ALC3]WDL95563.1 sulfite exporter TauE/SafE family protein [Alicyclobacillus sp. ALC3]
MPSVSVWLAFAAGLLSFVSPCTLPMFPSYLGYITGVSFQQLSGTGQAAVVGAPVGPPPGARSKAFLHALFFSIGLSVLFVALGLVSTTIGRFFVEYKSTVRLVAGVVIVVMGLFMAGAIRSSWLLRERRFRLPQAKPLGYFGSVLVGIGFAAGWTPCVGPILSTVLMMTAANPSVGTWYMVVYALGFSVPFLVFAVTLTSLRPILRYTERIAKAGGWLMVVMGILLVSDKLTWITVWIERSTGFTGIGL